MPRWLNSFSDLAGIVVIRESSGHRLKKLQRSIHRDGLLRTIDLLAYRLFHKYRHAAADRKYENEIQESLGLVYPPVTRGLPLLETASPNSLEAQAFIRSCEPDVMLACCKHILKPEVFEQAPLGTFVMHPGICPEYRNAHGCFWALVNGDMERVGMTLLKIDRGIDTGPVFGYFSAPYDELRDSHLTIQRRMTYGNLRRVQQVFEQLEAGIAAPLSTSGRVSAVWGQPTLSKYWRWKRAAAHRVPSAKLQLSDPSREVESLVSVPPPMETPHREAEVFQSVSR